MVRTKKNTAARMGSKAPRKAISTPALDLKGRSIADLFKTKSYCADTGNPYCPRETPSWQKEITKFFPPLPKAEAGASTAEAEAGASTATPTSSSSPRDVSVNASEDSETESESKEDSETESESNDTT